MAYSLVGLKLMGRRPKMTAYALNTIEVKLLPGESVRIGPVSPLVLSNNGGVIQLIDIDL